MDGRNRFVFKKDLYFNLNLLTHRWSPTFMYFFFFFDCPLFFFSAAAEKKKWRHGITSKTQTQNSQNFLRILRFSGRKIAFWAFLENRIFSTGGYWGNKWSIGDTILEYRAVHYRFIRCITSMVVVPLSSKLIEDSSNNYRDIFHWIDIL